MIECGAQTVDKSTIDFTTRRVKSGYTHMDVKIEDSGAAGGSIEVVAHEVMAPMRTHREFIDVKPGDKGVLPFSRLTYKHKPS